MALPNQPVIRQYIAPGGIGWILALLVLIICVVAAALGKPSGVSPLELFLIGMVAASRLC
jgi:hypothetical protein